jgi:hypothetical protein
MPLLLNNNPNPRAVMLNGQHLRKVMLGGDVVWQKHRPGGQNLILETLGDERPQTADGRQQQRGVKLVATNQNGNLFFPMYFQSHKRDDWQSYKDRLTFIGDAELSLQTIDAMLEADVTGKDMQLPMFFFDRRPLPQGYDFRGKCTFIANLPAELILETIDGLLSAEVRNGKDMYFPMVFPANKPTSRSEFFNRLTFIAKREEDDSVYADFQHDFPVNTYNPEKDFIADFEIAVGTSPDYIQDFPVNAYNSVTDFTADFPINVYDPAKDFVQNCPINAHSPTTDFIADFPINVYDLAKDFIKDFPINVYNPEKDFTADFPINVYDLAKDFMLDFVVNAVSPTTNFIKDFTISAIQTVDYSQTFTIPVIKTVDYTQNVAIPAIRTVDYTQDFMIPAMITKNYEQFFKVMTVSQVKIVYVYVPLDQIPHSGKFMLQGGDADRTIRILNKPPNVQVLKERQQWTAIRPYLGAPYTVTLETLTALQDRCIRQTGVNQATVVQQISTLQDSATVYDFAKTPYADILMFVSMAVQLPAYSEMQPPVLSPNLLITWN